MQGYGEALRCYEKHWQRHGLQRKANRILTLAMARRCAWLREAIASQRTALLSLATRGSRERRQS